MQNVVWLQTARFLNIRHDRERRSAGARKRMSMSQLTTYRPPHTGYLSVAGWPDASSAQS